jgi:hypothetical protein
VKKNEDYGQVFIIRIWRELHENPGIPPEWRGVIEHLQSKRRVYIRDLNKVIQFISPYLEEMGVVNPTPLKKKISCGKYMITFKE